MKNFLQEFRQLPALGKAMIGGIIYFTVMTAFLWICIATGNFPLNM